MAEMVSFPRGDSGGEKRSILGSFAVLVKRLSDAERTPGAIAPPR